MPRVKSQNAGEAGDTKPRKKRGVTSAYNNFIKEYLKGKKGNGREGAKQRFKDAVQAWKAQKASKTS